MAAGVPQHFLMPSRHPPFLPSKICYYVELNLKNVLMVSFSSVHTNCGNRRGNLIKFHNDFVILPCSNKASSCLTTRARAQRTTWRMCDIFVCFAFPWTPQLLTSYAFSVFPAILFNLLSLMSCEKWFVRKLVNCGSWSKLCEKIMMITK